MRSPPRAGLEALCTPGTILATKFVGSILHQKWLILYTPSPFKSSIDLMKSRNSVDNYLKFLPRNYENFPSLPSGLRAQDCDWMWLQCAF